ncbi:hypothetical protein OAX78_02850 [Planctomycetota bacterium]|nr:hypothetical protein [Planctomycetota bacterium]
MSPRRKASLRLWLSPLMLAFLALPLVHAQDTGAPAQPPQPPQRVPVAQIHDEVAAAGILVISVRNPSGDTCEVILAEGASAGQQAQADAIATRVIAQERGRRPIVVDNLSDALVVLRFEPDNVSAQELVRTRYQELKRTR